MGDVVREHLIGVGPAELRETAYGLADNPLGEFDDGRGSREVVGGHAHKLPSALHDASGGQVLPTHCADRLTVMQSGMRISVFCGASPGTDAHRGLAAELGTQMAQRGVGLVYGGGDVGLMGAAADAALAAGGEVIGVIPQRLVEAEVAHRGLTELIVVDTMHARKALMSELSHASITLPGGFGTLDETFEMLTWNQLGYVSKPVVFLDPDGFWDPIFEQIERMRSSGLMSERSYALMQRSDSIPRALDLATAARRQIG